jgi:hypothetical protein
MQESLPLPARISTNISQLAEQYKLGQPLSKHRRIFLYLQFVGVLVLCGWAISMLIQIIQIRNVDAQIYAQDQVWVAQNLAKCRYCSADQKAQLNQEKIDLLGSDLKNLSLDKYYIEEAALDLVIPFLLLLIVYLESKLRLYVCSDGLLYMKGKQATALPWDEISEISWFYGLIRHISQKKNEKNKKLPIWTMSKAWKVSKMVEKQIMPRLLTGARIRYAWNGIADFGSVSVSREGVERTSQRSGNGKKQELVAWESLEEIRFVRGAIFLKSDGKWERWTGGFWAQLFEHKPVLNPTICVALVKEILELGAWNKL